MGKIEELGWHIILPDPIQENKNWTLHFLNSGVPHLVTFIDDIDALNILEIGSYFRNHEKFAPHGANVNFIDINSFKIRTFERGVEAETLACGTGATASAYAMHKIYNIKMPIKLQ